MAGSTRPDFRHSIKQAVGLGCAVALCAVATVSCSSGGATTATADTAAATTTLAPVSGGLLSVELEADPNGLDPTRNAWDTSGLTVANALYDTWAAYDKDGHAQPYLAAGFDHNDAYTEWKIRIRPGITFSDGTPLDAAAAVRMIQGIKASAVTGLAAINITDAAADDPLTVKVTMAKPWASFPALMTGQGGTVVAPKQLDDPEGTVHPIGTGPFVLQDWQSGSSLTVSRNDHYWRKDAAGTSLPYLKGVKFTVVSDPKQRMTALRDGTVDIAAISGADEADAADIARTANLVKTQDEGPGETMFLTLNTAKAPLDDVRVRQALAYAIDPAKVAAAGGFPADVVASSLFEASSPWHSSTSFPHGDPDKAKALVKAYEDEKGPIAFKLSIAGSAQAMQVVVDQWAAVGIDATLDIVDVHKAVLIAVGGNYDAMLLRYFAAQDPDTLWHFWSSQTMRPIGGISLNMARLSDPALDTALDLGRSSADPTVRKQAYATVEQRFADLVPYIWLTHIKWSIFSRPKVHNPHNVTLPDGTAAAPFDVGVFRLTETWIQT